MPQPIPEWKQVDFDFRRTAVLQRPELAAYIASISSHWNEIESRTAVFLAALLGGEARTVIQVFLSLQSDGAKRATIDTVTELKLPSDQLERFREIQKTIGKRYSERNKAIHGMWGTSPQYPDDLLWYDARDSIAMFPELMARIGPSGRDERVALLENQKKKLLVYTKKDFVDVVNRMEAAFQELDGFVRPFVAPLFLHMTV